MGVFNTLVDAKAEEDLARRDALLGELRALREGHPDDAAVREQLAMGLVHKWFYADAEDDVERRGAILQELRGLAEVDPSDETMRQIVTTVENAAAENAQD
jgi:hypothetical protein